MAKDDFVNAGLYKQDKITAAAKKDSIAMNTVPENTPAETQAPAHVTDKEYNKAIKSRLEEFAKFKRDIQSRYTEATSVAGIKAAKMRLQLNEVDKIQQFTEHSLHELALLDPEKWQEDSLTSELAGAMKKLDNLRLELIRQNSRIDEILSSSANDKATDKNSSPALDLMSLSFGQLFRLGMIVSLPLLFMLFFGLGIIAIAVYFSTRV